MRAPPLLAVALLFGTACDGTEPAAPPTAPAAAPGRPALAPVTKSPAEDEAARTLATAKALLGNDLAADPPRAAALLTATFGSAPADAEAAFWLARATFRAGDPDRCGVALDALFGQLGDAAASATAKAWASEGACLRGWIAERAGRLAEAVARHREAIALRPDYAYGHYRLGVALGEGGEGEQAEAIAAIERATALQPGLIEAHFQLARLHRRGGRAADAARESEIHRNLNAVTDNNANTKEAVLAKYAACEKLEQIYPHYVDGRLALTRLQVARGMQDEALTRMRKLVQERPDVRDAWALYVDVARRALGDAVAQVELADLLRAAGALPAAVSAEFEPLARRGFAR